MTDLYDSSITRRFTLRVGVRSPRSIEKYGCYSCHNIKGFEGLKPIGTELTTEGSKALHLFDFGFLADEHWMNEDGTKEHVLHNVPSWVYNKLRNPRIYDDKRTKI